MRKLEAKEFEDFLRHMSPGQEPENFDADNESIRAALRANLPNAIAGDLIHYAMQDQGGNWLALLWLWMSAFQIGRAFEVAYIERRQLEGWV